LGEAQKRHNVEGIDMHTERLVKNGIRVTVSGSFNRHWKAVKDAIDTFRAANFEVLSPQGEEPESTKNGFVYLKGEKGKAEDIERRHLGAIARSDALYVVTSGGYVGPSVALEIGYALAVGVPVWSSERLAEVPHRDLVQVGSVAEVIANLQEGRHRENEIPSDKVRDLQKYYAKAAKRRGFDSETPEHALILLVEEVGELAKALRARIGISVQADDTSRKSVRLELADCFIYLLHMANQTDNDLYAAFCEKERLNARKRWLRRQGEEPARKS